LAAVAVDRIGHRTDVVGDLRLRAGWDCADLHDHACARSGRHRLASEPLTDVSGTVKDLVVGSGIEFTERGENSLKGVPGSWKLFAVED
jgi:hypothetical protein